MWCRIRERNSKFLGLEPLKKDTIAKEAIDAQSTQKSITSLFMATHFIKQKEGEIPVESFNLFNSHTIFP